MSGQTSSTPPPPQDHAGDHAAGNTQNHTEANVSATAAIGRNSARRDASVAAICGLVVALMVGSAYAAVPLYDWFCRVTGFNGTTQRATAMPTGEPGRKITVRFDSNISGGLPWRFRPEKTEIDVRIGEVVTAYYTVTNLSARHTMAQAGYNVAPLTAGAYFQKINCFCFTDQEMGPGETREMAVVFYVDEAIGKDVDHSNLDTLTLSYTFYPVKDDKVKPLAAAPSATGKGNL